MASDGIACRILIQNEQLAQVNTFPYLGSLITEDGECTAEFRTRLSKGRAIGASLQNIWKSHSIPISTKIRLMKAQVWSVVTYGCESWTLMKYEETSLEAFEMKGLRKILRVSRTAKKTNEWVLNKAGVKRELLDTVKARKLAYYGHTMRKLECGPMLNVMVALPNISDAICSTQQSFADAHYLTMPRCQDAKTVDVSRSAPNYRTDFSR